MFFIACVCSDDTMKVFHLSVFLHCIIKADNNVCFNSLSFEYVIAVDDSSGTSGMPESNLITSGNSIPIVGLRTNCRSRVSIGGENLPEYVAKRLI